VGVQELTRETASVREDGAASAERM
jgi:hypothetical protein